MPLSSIKRVVLRRAAPVKKAPAAATERMNRPFDPERRARPSQIGHIVFNIPRLEIDKVLAFYLERLQFRLTDRALDTGINPAWRRRA